MCSLKLKMRSFKLLHLQSKSDNVDQYIMHYLSNACCAFFRNADNQALIAQKTALEESLLARRGMIL